MKLSVVIPVMNEEENIEPLLRSVKESLGGVDYEIILVDDGSTDKTVERIKERIDELTKLIVFARNFGQTAALAAGIEAARGEYIVTMDGDLQNDPADIPRLINKLESGGWDVVAGRRVSRQDKALSRKLPSKIANALIRKTTGVNLSDYGCTLKIFRKDVAKHLGLYGELHRFMPVLAKLYGARITEMDVKHHPRVYGISKYGLRRTLRVVSDLLFVLFLQKYQQKPMHFFGLLGIIMFGLGFFINLYLTILKFFGEDIGNRPLLFLGMLLILGGIQLITAGFVAELIMRTYFESQNKKPYTIRTMIDGRQNIGSASGHGENVQRE